MSKNDPQIVPGKLNLKAVHIEKAAVEHPEGFDTLELSGFTQNVSQDVALKLQDELYRLRITFQVVTKMKQDSPAASGAFSLLVYFQVEDLKDWVIDEDQKEHIHQMLATTLFSIAYSTARGILLTRFQGTVFSNFVLPIINPAAIFQNNHTQ